MGMPAIDSKYYNGEKLLNEKDKNGNIAGIYLSNTNRSAGKTTYFQLFLLNQFLDNGKQFINICRNKYEIEDIETMFEFVLDNYFPDVVMTTKMYVKNLVVGIYLNNKLAGYAICLKDANKLKKYSAIFAGVEYGIMDELQPEDGHYIRNETDLMESIIKTVSRGNGSQVRNVTWIYLSNNINIMNPYFLKLGIYKYIPDKMQIVEDKPLYIKGEGYVAEFAFNKSAAKQAANNGALKAFSNGSDIMSLSNTAEFMIKSNAFIESPKGKLKYLFTLKYKSKMFGVRYSEKTGKVYVTQSYDPSFKLICALTASDHDELTIQLRTNTFYMARLRDSYVVGNMRFSDLTVKNTIIELLGVDLYR